MIDIGAERIEGVMIGAVRGGAVVFVVAVAAVEKHGLFACFKKRCIRYFKKK